MMKKREEAKNLSIPTKSNTSSNESSDEDEEESQANLWTKKDEENFLRTLGALKTGDPRIYEDKVAFFSEKDDSSSLSMSNDGHNNNEITDNNKMTLKDFERKLILERGGHLSEDEDFEDQPGPSYQKQDQLLKEEFKNALASSDEESDSGDLLKKRVKTEEEKMKEEEDYYEWLKNESSTLNIHDKNLQKLKERWAKDDGLEEDEKFLRDFLLYKKYEGEADEKDRIPTYDEIIREDEEEDRADEFEKKFNFRFEEPDQEFLKQYPRTSREALRKTETKRKLKRKEVEKKIEKKQKKRKIEQVDIPFRYRSVVPNSFGLTTEEILEADDRCLNAWAPISKVSQYRNEDEESRQIAYFERKAKNTQKKQKILHNRELLDDVEKAEEIGEFASEEKNEEEKPSTSQPNMTKKKRKKEKLNNSGQSMKKKKKKLENGIDLGVERMKAYGVSLKKLRRAQFSRKASELKQKNKEN